MRTSSALTRFFLFFVLILALFFAIEIVPQALRTEHFFSRQFAREMKKRTPRMLIVAVAASFLLSRRMKAHGQNDDENEQRRDNEAPPAASNGHDSDTGCTSPGCDATDDSSGEHGHTGNAAAGTTQEPHRSS